MKVSIIQDPTDIKIDSNTIAYICNMSILEAWPTDKPNIDRKYAHNYLVSERKTSKISNERKCLCSLYYSNVTPSTAHSAACPILK